MDASCKIQRSIHDVRLTYKYVSRILGTYQSLFNIPSIDIKHIIQLPFNNISGLLPDSIAMMIFTFSCSSIFFNSLRIMSFISILQNLFLTFSVKLALYPLYPKANLSRGYNRYNKMSLEHKLLYYRQYSLPNLIHIILIHYRPQYSLQILPFQNICRNS